MTISLPPSPGVGGVNIMISVTCLCKIFLPGLTKKVGNISEPKTKEKSVQNVAGMMDNLHNYIHSQFFSKVKILQVVYAGKLFLKIAKNAREE